MLKFNITLFIMITFLYGSSHPQNTTLKWNQIIFGNCTKVKSGHSNKYKFRSNKTIHCKLINQKQRRIFSTEIWIISMINQLFSLNEMRINGIITNKEYKRAKGKTIKKWNRPSFHKYDQTENALKLLTTIHKTYGFNKYEYNRLKSTISK